MVTTPDDGGADASASDASSSDGGGARDASIPIERCPIDPQVDGLPCPYPKLECEYGVDPDVRCNRLVICRDDQIWAVRLPLQNGCPSGAGVPAGCAATFAAVPRGKACTPSALLCDYPEGRCTCANVQGGAQPPPDAAPQIAWVCEDPGPACPTPRPKVGAACATEGQSCDYASCVVSGGMLLTCTRGAWRQGSPLCPP
jgi:hypothetical protein